MANKFKERLLNLGCWVKNGIKNAVLAVGTKVVNTLLAAEGGVNFFLGLASIVAVLLMVAGELVDANWIIPYLHTSWGHARFLLRAGIWFSFVFTFVLYLVLSKRPLRYMREHFLELIICITWVPQYSAGPVTILNDLVVLSRVVPLDVLQLVGTLAHVWRVLKFTVQRFSEHPIYVTGAAAFLLVVSSSAALTHIEPQTYKDFWLDAAWFVLNNITTNGHGTPPVTGMGKLATAVITVAGMSLLGVFLGLSHEIVRVKLLNRSSSHEAEALRSQIDHLVTQLAETKAVVDKLEEHKNEAKALAERLETQHSETKALLMTLLDAKAPKSGETAPPNHKVTEGAEPKNEKPE